MFRQQICQENTCVLLSSVKQFNQILFLYNCSSLASVALILVLLYLTSSIVAFLHPVQLFRMLQRASLHFDFHILKQFNQILFLCHCSSLASVASISVLLYLTSSIITFLHPIWLFRMLQRVSLHFDFHILLFKEVTVVKFVFSNVSDTSKQNFVTQIFNWNDLYDLQINTEGIHSCLICYQLY